MTKKELDEVLMKPEGKRPMCWNFLLEQLCKQPVMKLETHRKLIEEILEARYNELRNLVNHIFSVYMEHVSAVAEEEKKDRKLHLTLRWMNTLTSYLEGSSKNSELCAPVFTDLSINHSSATIRAVTGIVHSLVYDFTQSESYNLAKPVDQVQQSILPEDDVTLYRMSGAALCQMIKLRKDTLSEKKGKRKLTSQSRINMELELGILEKLKESDKNSLSQALKLLDEGNLTFVKKDFLNFVRDADLTIREYVSERKVNKHKNNFLEVVHFNVYNDEQLLKSFKWSIGKCGALTTTYPFSVINKIYRDTLHKLYNTRTKEFFRGKFEELAKSGKVVEAGQSLREPKDI